MKHPHLLTVLFGLGLGVATLSLPVLAQQPHPASQPGHTASPQPAPPKPAPQAPPPAPQPGQVNVDTQGPIQHGPGVQRDRRHLRAGYWSTYGDGSYGGYGGGRSGVVHGGNRATTGGVPAAPGAVAATHNYDGSVTVTWVMPAGAAVVGDVYQVGRRLPGQSDFWLLGETTVASLTDRTTISATGNVQYRVVVRRGGAEGRGGVYGPVSPIASANLNHPRIQRWQQPQQQQDRQPAKPPPKVKPNKPADPKPSKPAATPQ